LAFKANIDGLRASPALEITRELIAAGMVKVMACDPNANGEFEKFPSYRMAEMLKEANIFLKMAEHVEFKRIDLVLLKEKVVIDTRGIYR